jgi:NAD(P)-dependent dehydrogenase (short-subunit alcohol dehydrogenase family)
MITGASRGIGRAVTMKLARTKGVIIVAVARSSESLASLATVCNQKAGRPVVGFHAADLSSDITDNGLTAKIAALPGGLDILINNAGAFISKPFPEMQAGDFDHLFHTNVRGPFLLTRALLPYFNRGGHIVNIGSMGGFQGSTKFTGLSLYSASKAALACLSECLAVELAGRQVSVNCLAIGAADTGMLKAAFPNYTAPLSADDMASFVADFALKGHRFFNGKILPVALSTP